MKKQLLLALAGLLGASMWAADVVVAHSVKDWEAAGKGVPAQGFKNWEFGYFEKENNPASFKRMPKNTSVSWGDGNFTYGAIFKDEIAWSTHAKKFNVARCWTVPAAGKYVVELSGKHALKINGKEVSWGRKFFVFVNNNLRKEMTFPGRKFGTETLTLELKKGDKIYFAAHRGGSKLLITIQIKQSK